MAAEIDLETPDQARSGQHPAVMSSGLSSLYVVGVREPGQRTVEEEAVALADLLTRHASLDNLALVAQGTATNNLTDRPSGWTSAADPYAATVGSWTPPWCRPRSMRPCLSCTVEGPTETSSKLPWASRASHPDWRGLTGTSSGWRARWRC